MVGNYRESLEKDRILGTLDIAIPDFKEDILSSKGEILRLILDLQF